MPWFSHTSDRFQTLNAWYLSDAAFLAYASAKTPEEVEARIRAPLERLFSSVQRRDEREAPVRVKVFIAEGDRSQALIDPIQCYVADDGVMCIVAFRGTLPTHPQLAHRLQRSPDPLARRPGDPMGWADSAP